MCVHVLCKTLASADNNLSAAVVGSPTLPLQKDNQPNLPHISVGRENWGDSNMADGSPRTDTSTDDTEEKNQRVMPLMYAAFKTLARGFFVFFSTY